MRDIQDKEDIKILVDAFYEKVRQDDLIGRVFALKIKDGEWPRHLERMYSFWNTVLFGQRDYRGNPFSKHATLPIDAPHFERWIELLGNTLDEHFAGEKANEVKDRAAKMGLMFQAKLTAIRSNENYTNLM